MTTTMPTIQYGIANIKSYEAKYNDNGTLTSLVIDNQIEATPTERFWTSLWCQFSSFGLSPKLPKLFTYREIFDRLHERLPEHGGELRYAIETTPGGNRLLGLSRPSKAFLAFEPTLDLIRRNSLDPDSVSYSNGMIRANHAPAHMADFKVGPDDFSHRYVTDTPVDGFGLPAMFLSLFRTVCSNGAVAMSTAFKSSIPLGDDETDPVATLARAIESFNNEEGYAALRDRFEAASKSWASIRECQKAYKIISKLATNGALTLNGKLDAQEVQDPAHAWTHESIFQGRKGMIDSLCHERSLKRRLTEDGIDMKAKVDRAYLEMSGDFADLYRLTSVDALTDKKQGQLPAKCTVYDLINFCTELSTHYTTGPTGAKSIDGFVGDLVTSEYDLEKSVETYSNYQDFFTDINAPSAN